MKRLYSPINMATSAEAFIRAIRHTNDLVLEYIRIPPNYNQVDFLLKIFNETLKHLPVGFEKLSSFTLTFGEFSGYNYLNELLCNWNKIKFDNFTLNEHNPELKLIRLEGTGAHHWQINDWVIEKVLSENQLTQEIIPFLISSKIWRGLYDYKIYKLNRYSYNLREMGDNGHNNSSHQYLKYFAYNLHNKTGIPDFLWNNPAIRPHMLSDPYIKDCIVPLTSTDIPFLKSETTDSSLIETKVETLSDQLLILQKQLEKTTNTSKLVEIIGNLEKRIEDLERKPTTLPEPTAPSIIDYHKMYMEQLIKTQELEKTLEELKIKDSDPIAYASTKIKEVIDSMPLEEHFWHSLQKRISLDVTGRPIIINKKQYTAYPDNPIIYTLDNKPVGRLNYDYRSCRIEIVKV